MTSQMLIVQLQVAESDLSLLADAIRSAAEIRRRAAGAAAQEIRADAHAGRDVRRDAVKLLDVLADADTLTGIADQLTMQLPAPPPPAGAPADQPPAPPAPTPAPQPPRTSKRTQPKRLPGDGDAALAALTVAGGARTAPGQPPGELGPPPGAAAALAEQVRAAAAPSADGPPGFDVYEEP